MPDPIEIPTGSQEHIRGIVDADTTNPLTMSVALSLTAVNGNGTATEHDWQPAEWTGDPSSRRLAQSTELVTHEPGRYRVHARLDGKLILASENEVLVT